MPTHTHIAYTNLDAIEAWLDHDKGRLALLYCKTGPMSLAASQKLVERGYWNIYDMPKGIAGWATAGYPYSTKKGGG